MSWLRDWKERGNEAYKAKQYTEAEKDYTQAIDLYRNKWGGNEERDQVNDDDRLVICQILTNRAACRCELGRYKEAVEDGKEAIAIYPCHWKAYYRTSKAYGILGDIRESSELLVTGIKHGRPDREQRCKMLVPAMLMSLKLPPDPLAMLLGIPADQSVLNKLLLSQIVSLVQNTHQWKQVFRLLGEQNEWQTAKVVLDMVDEEKLLNCAEQTNLQGLVTYAEGGDRKWCDSLATELLLLGGCPETLGMEDEPKIFGALRLGLKGEGELKTLRFFLEFVLIHDCDGKNATNKQGQNVYQYIEHSTAAAETKTEARRMLKAYGVGDMTDEEVLAGVQSMLTEDATGKTSTESECEKMVVTLTKKIGKMNDDTPLVTRARLHFQRSGVYKEVGRFHEACLDARQAVELLPTYSDAYRRLSGTCSLLDYSTDANDAKLHAIRFDSEVAVESVLKQVLLRNEGVAGRQTLEKVLKILNPSLVMWNKVVRELYAKEKWRTLTALFSLCPAQQGFLHEFRADDLSLEKLVCSDGNIQKATFPLFVHLLKRGAKLESFIPKFENPLCTHLIKGRPVSYAFVEKIIRSGDFLECLIEREEELKEPNYPDPDNLIHRLIETYKSISASDRIVYLEAIILVVMEFKSSSSSSDSRESLILELNDPEAELYGRCETVLENVKNLYVADNGN